MQRLYKVLIDGKSCHGGDLAWPLPDGDQPGEWVRVEGRLVMCSNGLHLTREPVNWWVEGSTLYEAEYRGESVDDGGEKVCVREARLLRVAPWSEGNVFSEGEHEITGNAQATLYGNAQARLYDNASARLTGNAQATLCDNASARLYDNASATSDYYHSPSAAVALQHMAAHIDRRGGKLVIRTAKGTGAELAEVE